jgi:hypothetical protein
MRPSFSATATRRSREPKAKGQAVIRRIYYRLNKTTKKQAKTICFIQCGKFIKPVATDDPEKTLQEFQENSPLQMILRGSYFEKPEDANVELEEFRRDYGKFHHKNGWFILSEEVEYIVDSCTSNIIFKG